jgi:hypothetical protein
VSQQSEVASDRSVVASRGTRSRPLRENGDDGQNVPRSEGRHRRNFDGAFPLLIVGSFLIVLAGILASSELTSKSSHLPLFGLIGGVGAVVIGAGIYSTYLDPEEPPESNIGDDWVAVPKAEWEALRSDAQPEDPYASPIDDPPWLERPGDRGVDSLVATFVPVRVPVTTESAPVPPTPAEAPPRPVAPAETRTSQLEADLATLPGQPSWDATIDSPSTLSFGKGSLKALEAALTDLEGLVYKDAPPAVPEMKPVKPAGPPICVDCDRNLTSDPSPPSCEGCSRALCVNCAYASISEDGKILCIPCRGRKG